MKQIEIRRATTANRTNNRRTANFNAARPELDEHGNVVSLKSNLDLNNTEVTVRETEKAEKDSQDEFKLSTKSTVLLAPAPAEIPRKAGVRMAMEHKLGIDWEHGGD